MIDCNEIETDNGNEFQGHVNLLNHPNPNHPPVSFTCDEKLCVEPGDVLRFELANNNNESFARNVRISKYHGVRYTAHVEKLAADIFMCNVIHEESKDNIEVYLFTQNRL